MSWKGFTKAIGRLPARINKGSSASNDEEYNAASKEILTCASETRVFYDKIRKVKDSLNAMLAHETNVARFYKEVFEPLTDHDDPLTDSSIRIINSIEFFYERISQLKESLRADLDYLERQVITPTYEFTAILNNVKRLMEKRDRKRLDYDRFTASIEKLRNSPSRSVNDEKKLAQLEADLDVSTRDFTDLNNSLKQQIPIFLGLKDDFIGTCFLTIYNYQLKYYKETSEVFNDVLQHSSSVFGSSQDPNVDFTPRYGHMLEILEGVSLTLKSPPAAAGTFKESARIPATSTYSQPAYNTKQEEHSAYSSNVDSSEALPGYSGLANNIGGQYVIALFDYEAQAEGDLSFKTGDHIELLEKTEDSEDWWRGRLNGVEGVFPGNFVQET